MDTTFKKLVLFSLPILLGVGIVYAVSYAFKPKSSTQVLTVKEVNDEVGVELAMTLQKTEYSLGEPINITLTITNISNQTINFKRGDPSFDFQVYNDKNYSVYLDSAWKIHSYGIVRFPFPAGESFSHVLVWGQTCNVTSMSEGVPVSAGTYHIVGLYDTYGLRTTPIQITIAKP